MNRFSPVLIIIIVAVSASCSTKPTAITPFSRNQLDKSYNDSAIPAAFDKNKITLLVTNGFRQKKYKQDLETIFKTVYTGNSIQVKGKDIDVLYTDLDKYRYILNANTLYDVRNFGTSNAYSTLEVWYVIHDRITKKDSPRFFLANRTWKVSAVYVAEKLNAKK